MKSYKGRRIPGKCLVVKNNGQMLRMCCDIVNHSPTGPEWGYEGSGPAQLALALLLDYFGDEKLPFVQDVYQHFKRDIIAELPKDEWTITAQTIESWFSRRKGEVLEVRCPKCGARESLVVASYQVGNANCGLSLAFDAETHKAIDFEFNRIEGEVSAVECVCCRCNREITLDEIMEAHQ